MTGYVYSQVFDASVEYFKGDEFAAKVFADKYALHDKNNIYYDLTPDDMHKRLAKEFARIESKYPNPMTEDEIYDLLKNFKYICAQGSPMSAIGNPFFVQSAGNCFVINPPYDSYGGICKTDQELAQLMKRRAGVGVDISNIRPKGLSTNNAAKTTDGIGIFMERFSNTCREVAQCLHGDTLVLTINGLKKISSINPGDEVWTNQKWVGVDKVLKNKKPLVKITTKSGKEILCSPDHVFHTIDGEKSAKDFSIGSPVTQIVGNGWMGKNINLITTNYKKRGINKSSRLNKNVKLPNVLDEKLSYLLGLMYGDGCIERSSAEVDSTICVALSDDWGAIKDKYLQYSKDVFNITPSIKQKTNEACSRGRLYSREIIEHLKNNNLLKQKSKDIIFPEQLLSAHTNVVFSFISGFFDSDGCVQNSKKQYKISSTSKNFLLNIQNVFSAHGVSSCLHKEDRASKGWQDLYELTINGNYSQKTFKSLMIESVKVQSNSLFEKSKDHTRSIYKFSDLSNKSVPNYLIDKHHFISRSSFEKVKSEGYTSDNLYLLQDFVKTIESYDNSTEHDTYDLVLSKEHLFFGNGLYVHNSGRRGALMLSISVKHPEISTFVNIKKDLKKVTGANISIRLSDEFMNAVKKDENFTLQWPDTKPQITKDIKAKDLWKEIIFNAWNSAEPGLFFWDNVIKYSPESINGKAPVGG